MILKISDSSLYIDNHFVCFCGAGNGRPNIPTGRYQVVPEYSHVHGRVLLDAIGIGWMGASPECDIVLGRVRGVRGVIPSRADLERLCAIVETAIEHDGRTVILEVK